MSMPLTAPSLRVEPGRRDRLTHRRAGNENRGIQQLSIFVMSPFSRFAQPAASHDATKLYLKQNFMSINFLNMPHCIF
jgi:hypothetical protein